MRPAAAFCPCVGGQVPLDHWSSGACKNPPIYLPFLLGILANTLNDPEHSGGAITATRVSGCPRATLIQDYIGPTAPRGGLVLDPRRLNSAAWGWALHEFCAKHAPKDSLTEIRFPWHPETAPELDFGGGVKARVSGRVDYIPPDSVAIMDLKTHSESALLSKWLYKGNIDPDLIVQFNVLRELVKKDLPNANITKGTIWHAAMTPAMRTIPGCKACGAKKAKMPFDAPSWFTQELPVVSLAEVGAMKTKGAQHSVRDIVAMLVWATKEIASLTEEKESPEWYAKVDAVIAKVPMVGEPMYGGEMCTTYCGAPQPYCFALAGRARVL